MHWTTYMGEDGVNFISYVKVEYKEAEVSWVVTTL